MLRRLLGLAVLAVSAAALSAAPALAKLPKLEGEVSGNGAFEIEVKQKGRDVETLKAGRYLIVVEDPATIHDFRLKGPGLNRATSVSGTGTFRWTVRLKKGRYTYQCDPHAASGMRGSFLVK